jgi:hypothetical protein
LVKNSGISWEMAKSASLKPHKNPARTQLSWVLNVPPELSETGKRSRHYFATEREAKAKAEELKTRRHNFGASLGNLTSGQIVEAADCQELLAEFPDASLKDAVLHYRQTLRDRAASIPFLKLFDLYLAKIQNRSTKHRDGMRQTRDRFPLLHEQLACDITAPVLEELLQPLPPASRDLTLRHWRSVFRYGHKRNYLRSNPIDQLDFAGTTVKEVEIYEVPAVELYWQMNWPTISHYCHSTSLGFSVGFGQRVNLKPSSGATSTSKAGTRMCRYQPA